MASKQALVFKTAHLFPLYEALLQAQPSPSNFDDCPFNEAVSTLEGQVGLMSRLLCEKDPSYLQLIPYIVLQDTSDGPGAEKYFVYSRGAKGGESRLFGKCSLGLGGHIEEEPTESKSLFDVLVDTAQRELEEEIGIDASKHFDLYTNLQQAVRNSVLHYGPADPVSSVHCAVMMMIPFERKQFNEKLQEEGVIEKGQWLSLEEIQRQHGSGEIELEAWSVAVIDKML